MNKSEKEQLVTELRDKIKDAKALYFTDFTGLNAADENLFECRHKASCLG